MAVGKPGISVLASPQRLRCLRVVCHVHLVPPSTSHTYGNADTGITFDTNGTLHTGTFAFAALVVIVWRQRDAFFSPIIHHQLSILSLLKGFIGRENTLAPTNWQREGAYRHRD